MRLPRPTLHSPLRTKVLSPPQWSLRRRLMTLAIETSCDDTSVAIVEKGVQQGHAVARLHFHKKVTSDNTTFQGVHPLTALRSHQQNLAALVADAILHLPPGESGPRLPDFVSVTRGPGMRSNLFTGLDTAKGLAVAWQRPLVGVHHMQAHALTPRLVAALEAYTPDSTRSEEPLQDGPVSSTPDFPFLSVLASGGHTILINSTSVTSHAILAASDDIAVGECLDKVARAILPSDELQKAKSTMYGAVLESFAFPSETPLNSTKSKSKTSGYSARQYLKTFGEQFKWYEGPKNSEEAMKRSISKWGWSINQPLYKSRGGKSTKRMEMSFSGLMSAVERLVQYQTDPSTKKITTIERTADISLEERRDMAQGVMRAAFEHISSRVVLGLQMTSKTSAAQPAVVMAGGVASNSFLRHVLASTLCVRGYPNVMLYFPPPRYCTDNAAMIGWTGLEMFNAGHVDPLSIRAIRKWPLNELLTPVEDG